MIATLTSDWVTVVVAFFTVVVSPVLIVMLNARLNKRVKSVKATTDSTLYEMKNAHPKNFREEGDDRHVEILAELKDLKADIAEVKDDSRTLRRDHSSIQRVMTGLLDRMQVLEHPAARKPRTPPKGA